MNTPIVKAKSAPVKLVRYEIPNVGDLKKMFPGRMEHQRNIAYVLHWLLFRTRWYKPGWVDGYYVISSTEMEKQLGGTGWQKCRRALLDAGIIIANGRWWSGGNHSDKRCQGYKLNPKVLGSVSVVVEYPRKRRRPRKSVCKSRPNDTSSPANAIERAVLANLGLLVVDQSYLNATTISAQDYNTLSDVSESVHTAHIDDECGRMFHTISNLNRSCMPYLTADNESLHCIDMTCCYPTILLNGMENRLTRYAPSPICPLLSKVCPWEAKHWGELVRQSKLYEFFMEHTGLSRERVKELLSMLLCSPLDKYGFTENKLLPVFKKWFASILGALCRIKSNHNLATELMRAESWIMLHNVGPSLQRASIYWLPNHDAVFVRTSDAERALQIIRQTIEEMGLRATFTIKPLPDRTESILSRSDEGGAQRTVI